MGLKNLKMSIGLNFKIAIYISFYFIVGRCRRKISLYWHDFRGNLVRYAVLTNGKRFLCDTYVTHPWSARDWSTGDQLLLNGQLLYYPQPWTEEYPDDDRRTIVNIDIPVYKLKEMCAQVIRRMLPSGFSNLTCLELPKTLTEDIRDIPELNFSKYWAHYQQNSDEEDEQSSDGDYNSDGDH